MSTKQLQKLEPRHRAAVRLKILGKRNDFIAEELGVQKRTLEVWFSDPIIKAELAEQLERVDLLFAERLVSSSMLGLDKLEELLQLQVNGTIDAETMLAIIRESLDRNPVTSKAARGGGSIHFNFGNMTDDELKDKARELVGAAIPAGPGTRETTDDGDGGG